MIYALMGVLLLACVYGPSLWIRWVFREYSKNIDSMPGTGGELAEHLIKRFEIDDCIVEKTDDFKDHYDPSDVAVRLSQANYDGKSLTAVAVAAHEVGHALQHNRNEKIFRLRKRYLPVARLFRQIGIMMLWLIPLIGLLLKAPPIMFGVLAFCFLCQIVGALSYLLVLPEEWDASFNKALPILVEGEYIRPDQIKDTRRILRAAAITYFASALADVLNIGRWLMVLLRR